MFLVFIIRFMCVGVLVVCGVYGGFVVGRVSNSRVNGSRKKFGYWSGGLRRFTSFRAFCNRVRENEMLDRAVYEKEK